MSDDLNSIVPVENADARRDLLEQQFEEAEQEQEASAQACKVLRRLPLLWLVDQANPPSARTWLEPSRQIPSARWAERRSCRQG